MKKGQIKFYLNEKGYGFIEDEEGNDHFFHCKEVEESEIEKLQKSQAVEFEVGEFKGRETAVNVRVIG